MWLLLLACGRSPAPSAQETFANVAPAEVTEVLPCGPRTLARVTEAQWDFWVSIPAQEVAPGQFLLLGKGPLKEQVTCGARTIAQVTEIEAAQVLDAEAARRRGRLDPPPGGLSIAEVMSRREALSGQPVKVRGRVVKVNEGVFGRNWLHLVDGSMDEGDLTVTSEATAKVGDVVVASAPLTINKDLGFGYFYEAILEDAVLEVE
ncbi:MAG: hypothetical protein H6739_09165 [Alphaproteobacteria bacterium]|nr:hypothetical protein [Alphaproteobacteria bacterium]